ncbi:MAG TPA: hypothetical protein VFA65_08640 [Bryobacteraceae bacterium]|nr:hypothetical protein [Bryobacteraceae bacterium]
MPLMDFVNVLQQYAGASASSPPASTQQDFERVAQSAPQDHLAAGLAEAFRSNQTPAFPSMLASMFGQSNGQQRAGILSQLLGSAGAGGGTGLGATLSSLLGSGQAVTPEQASKVSPEEVQQLAEQAHKHNPSIVETASNFYAQHPQLVQGLGAGAMALIMSHMSRRA